MADEVERFRERQRLAAERDYIELKEQLTRSSPEQILLKAKTIQEEMESMLEEPELAKYIAEVARPLQALEKEVKSISQRRDWLIEKISLASESGTYMSGYEIQLAHLDQLYRDTKQELHRKQASRPLTPFSYYILEELVNIWNTKLRLCCKHCGESVRFDSLGDLVPHPIECDLTDTVDVRC